MMLANVRDLNGNFQCEQKRDVRFQCTFCGKSQTIILILPSNQKQGVCASARITKKKSVVFKFYAQEHLEN